MKEQRQHTIPTISEKQVIFVDIIDATKMSQEERDQLYESLQRTWDWLEIIRKRGEEAEFGGSLEKQTDNNLNK